MVQVFDAHHYLKDRFRFSLDGLYIGGLMGREQ